MTFLLADFTNICAKCWWKARLENVWDWHFPKKKKNIAAKCVYALEDEEAAVSVTSSQHSLLDKSLTSITYFNLKGIFEVSQFCITLHKQTKKGSKTNPSGDQQWMQHSSCIIKSSQTLYPIKYLGQLQEAIISRLCSVKWQVLHLDFLGPLQLFITASHATNGYARSVSQLQSKVKELGQYSST